MKGLDKPLITPEDSLASVQVVEAAYRSIQQRNWQPVEPKP
jgi:predicted dehydrogenase